jgi:minor extracellular serine protease Vpr
MSMRRLWVILLCLPAFCADVVPNRYIVELSTESVGAQVARIAPRGTGKALLHSAAAQRHRMAIQAEQVAARSRIEAAGGRLLGAVETVNNALVVEIPDAQASRLASIPGVVRVLPVHRLHPLLDHALPLHNVPQAWSQVGISNAGAGIKIAMIDSGIDIGHPGFADAGFTMPAGFPLADTQADLAYTNNKVIVARSYANLFTTPDPDLSAADHVGHGTATAMVAAGVSNAGPLATISGVAPQAWLGSYKVFGTPGYNSTASDDVILMAINDAVNDGMDIINLSLGGMATSLAADMEAHLVDVADSLGVIVVVAAGNSGSDPYTISSPADAPSAIAAGAANNDRFFADGVVLPDNSSLVAVPGNGAYNTASVTGTLADVAGMDGSGLACSPLPAGSLTAAIALISRGSCTFESKIDNAQAAGAAAVVVYDNIAGEAIPTMLVGAAAIPAVMISNADGLTLKAESASALAVTVQLVPAAFYTNPAGIASFSARGPNIDFSIKPDVLAVGMNVYTAAERLDANGEVFSADGYTTASGTSFSAPLVAGAAAVVKQARPGLTADQYRSLLINSAAPAWLAPGIAAGVQQGGAGVLDVLAALNSTVAAAPVSLSFGTGGSTVDASQSLTLTNVGTVADTFQIGIAPAGSSAPAPQLTTTSVQLDPGASVTLPVVFQASSLTAGAYEGFINVQGLQSGVAAHVPYWYGVPSNQPAHITVLSSTASATAGSRLTNAILFRVTDAAGLPVTTMQPTISAVTSGAQAGSISPVNSSIPNAFAASVRLAPQAGNNVYQIQAGSLAVTVTIVGQ